MRIHRLALLACAGLVFGTLLPACSRTELIVPPGAPSPDIECGRQGPIPRTAFILHIDSDFTRGQAVRRVTWNIRHRCLSRTADAPPDATPGNCRSCFFPTTASLQVVHEPGHPLIVQPATWSAYRVENPVVQPDRYSFDAVGAPAARYCVDVWVELRDDTRAHSAYTTRLLTAAVHTDTEFRARRRAGVPQVEVGFVAEQTPENCAWAR